MTRDPDGGFGSTMWLNAGQTQMHVGEGPYQKVEGYVSLVVPSLDRLEARLRSVADALKGTRFSFARDTNFDRGEGSKWGANMLGAAHWLRSGRTCGEAPGSFALPPTQKTRRRTTTQWTSTWMRKCEEHQSIVLFSGNC